MEEAKRDGIITAMSLEQGYQVDCRTGECVGGRGFPLPAGKCYVPWLSLVCTGVFCQVRHIRVPVDVYGGAVKVETIMVTKPVIVENGAGRHLLTAVGSQIVTS